MESIKKFDEEFKKINSYYTLSCNVVKYIFTFSAICLMFFFPVTDDNWVINIYAVTSFGYISIMQVQPLLFVKQGKSNVPIIKLMRDVPIDRKAFIHSRIRHLYKYLIKITVASVVVRGFSLFVLETPTVERALISIFSMVLCLIISVGVAAIEIYMCTSRV